MKKITTILATLCVCATATVKAQIPYNLTIKQETYTALAGGTSVNGAKAWTDSTNYKISLGFSFSMGGKTISHFNMMDIGGVFTDTAGVVSGFTFMGTPLIDRGIKTGTSKSPIRYTTTGTAGSKIFKLEILNAGFAEENSLYSTLNDSINLQIWLYEGTNVAELRYGGSKVSNFNDYFFLGGPMVGYTKNLTAATGDFDKLYLLKGAPATAKVDSANTSTMYYPTLTAMPVTGTVYRFAPKSTGTSAGSFIHADNIKVYPTRCTDMLTVENNSNKDMNYQVLSLSGSLMSKGALNPGRKAIDVSSMAQGMYVLTLIDGEELATYKFIKL